MLTLDDIQVTNKKVIMREDFNVPMQNGHISDASRIDAALPSIKQLVKLKAKILLISHLGRPVEGEYDQAYSLAPVADYLSEALGMPVSLQSNWINGVNWQDAQIILAENVRFLKGEKDNDAALAKRMAALGDVFVMDAFAVAHRAQASTVGIIDAIEVACAGPLLVNEVRALDKALHEPKKPLLAIVAGAKISTKLNLLESLLKKVDQLIVGGGIANTFLAAAGYPIGSSLYEPDMINTAKNLLDTHTNILLPNDVQVAKGLSEQAHATLRLVTEVTEDEKIFDIGSATQKSYTQAISKAGTIIWNGPVGVFEYPAFSGGTFAIARAIASSKAYSLVGGGDSIAAINQCGVADDISYISTGGGAFLTYCQGEELPALVALAKHTAHSEIKI